MPVWLFPTRLRPVDILTLPLFFGLIGLILGAVITWGESAPSQDHAYPLPHHVPTYPGNLTLRFAMVHDMIHERFSHHGPDYYRARNQTVENSLGKEPTEKGNLAEQYLQKLDDRGVGLEFLGRHEEAVALMWNKLKLQERLGYQGRDLYSTYANLGTFLILWQLSEGVTDVPMAKERIGESVQWIHKAIEVYPQSHFGREKWQVVLEEFLLAVLDKPELLLKYDMVGNRLDEPLNPERAKCCNEDAWKPRGPWPMANAPANQAEEYLQAPDAGELPLALRGFITTVGAAGGWSAAVKTSHTAPAPFDEPALGIVGMWRMGAGANPHFALALAEIMIRVGQRYIAWTAYERASRLADHFWPDATIRDAFVAHCKARQQLIEAGLPDDWDAVRARFEKELQFGQNYQKEYQEYEARRLAEGASVEDPHFYDAFDASHGPVATPVGQEDTLVVSREVHNSSHWLGAIFFAGLFAFLAAFGIWLLLGRKRRPSVEFAASGKEFDFFVVWLIIVLSFFLLANLTGAIKWVGDRPFRFTGFPFTFMQWGTRVEDFFDWQLLLLNSTVAVVIAGPLAWLCAWDRCRWMAANQARKEGTGELGASQAHPGA
jgi:hypothetical protein